MNKQETSPELTRCMIFDRIYKRGYVSLRELQHEVGIPHSRLRDLCCHDWFDLSGELVRVAYKHPDPKLLPTIRRKSNAR